MLKTLIFREFRYNEDIEDSIKELKSKKEPFVLFLLGNICSRQGRILDACSYYDRAIFLDFDIITAHVDFGRKYEHMGRHEKAYKEYLAAYNLDPSDKDLKEKLDYVKSRFNKWWSYSIIFSNEVYMVKLSLSLDISGEI